MLIEGIYVYSFRHNLVFEEMVDNSDNVDWEELEKICKDLRFYKYVDSYELKNVTDVEYDNCLNYFNK